MAKKSPSRPRWVRNTDPHTPGALLKQGRAVIGRVLYSDMTRNYSCFVGESVVERWLGCAADLEAAKKKVDDARALDLATEFLQRIKPGQRVSLFDPRSVNYRDKWHAEFVLDGEQPNLPYNPICKNSRHFRIYMRMHKDVVCFISNLCACELANGSKRLAVWDMPEDAKHSMSATGFDNGMHYEDRRTWQSTMCGLLLETTGGVSLREQGHSSYITIHSLDRLTCPGCLMREGKPPQEIDGVTIFGIE
ncbi:hypothetical protein AB0F77_06170 [Streptomyces sp. NPDC026672]|uniref:hypothetical protein n=1 Tax=unclassified Streptomyces TaxID=2593676 RepID=UPI0033C4B8FA